MDRRQKKSRDAIFQALCRLMETRHFNSITVQEIIDEANVGRSTFYAHFETKDMLLRELCTEIFDHVFSHELKSEKSHDFSRQDTGLAERLTHLLYHLKDNKGNILGILSGESSELFLNYFKEYLSDLFRCYPGSICAGVPEDFALQQLVGSFAEAVKWWVRGGMKEPPEVMSDYYLKVIRYPQGGGAVHEV